MNTKKIFVSGATGFQGRPTAEYLINKGYQVTTLKRNIEDGQKAPDQVNVVEGGFENLASIKGALDGVSVAVFTLPMVFDVTLAKTMAQNFIEAAKISGIDRVVFNTSFDLPETKTGLIAIDIKVEIKALFDASGLNVTTISPDVYIDNLVAPWSMPLVLNQGILPYPIQNGVKIPWISHRDLAKFTVAVIENENLKGMHLSIGGNLFSGEEIAAAIGDQIRKPVQFISLSPDDFEQNLKPNFGEIMAREISNLYRFLENDLERISTKDFMSTQAQLNLKPESLKEWVETIDWTLG